MHLNNQAPQLPTRSSRRQRGLSPVHTQGSQLPITQTSTTPNTNSAHPSTAHEILHSTFHDQQSYPSIVNTINSNPDHLSATNIPPYRVSNAESLPPTFNLTNNQQNNYPVSVPANGSYHSISPPPHTLPSFGSISPYF